VSGDLERDPPLVDARSRLVRPIPTRLTRPISLEVASENQTFPSGPATTSVGKLLAVGTGNCSMVPDVEIDPTVFAAPVVNHRFPSGQAAIPPGGQP
jgi:hypothetical protein